MAEELTLEQKKAIAIAQAKRRRAEAAAAKIDMLGSDAEARPKPSYIPGAITAFGQGASFGFSDEMAAGLQSMLPYPYGTKGAGGYDAAVDSVRGRQKDYAAAYPVTDTVANLLGGVTTTLAAAGTMPAFGASSTLPRWAQYGSAGMASGALSGYGYADKDEGLEGAAIGGGLGLAGGVAGPPLSRVGGRALGLLRDASNAMRSPEKQAAFKMVEAMRRDGLNDAQIAARMRELGPDAVLADAGGANMLGLAESATTVPGAAKDSLLKTLTARMRGQGDRVNQMVLDSISDKPGGIATIRALDAERKALVSPLYDKAYSQAVSPSDALNDLLQKNSVKQAYREALKIASDEGDDIVKSLTLGKGGVLKFKDSPTFRTLDYLKRGLDDVIEKNTSDFGKLSPEGRRALLAKQQLVNILDEASPDYAAARKIYADSNANQRAMLLGRKIFREDYDILDESIQAMSQTEKDYFKAGVARAVMDKVDNSAATADRTRIFDKASVRKKLESVFGSKSELDKFISGVEAEQRKALTFTTVSGNSRTAARLAAQEDMLNPRSIAREILGINDIPQMTNDKIGQMLLSPDPAVIAQAQRYMATLKTGPVSLPGLFARSAVVGAPVGLMSQRNQ